MKKSKVTVKTGKAFKNTNSIQVTVPKDLRQKAKIRPGDNVICFLYEGPIIDMGIFTIRDGDIVYRKAEPVITV